jgi:hypothetical protein
MFDRIRNLSEAPLHRRVNERSLSLETVTVVVLGLLGGAGYAYFGAWFLGERVNPPPYTEINVLAPVLEPLIAVALLWIGGTVFCHYVSKFYGGRRPINRVFRASAWSLLPVGLWYLVRSIVVFVIFFFTVDFPADPEGVTAQEEINAVLELGLETPLFVAVELLGVLAAVWTWHLLSVGLVEAREVSLEDARRIAIVPAAALALYSISLALRWQTFF